MQYLTLVRNLRHACSFLFIRWTVVFRPNNPEEGDDAQTSEDNAQIFVMNNYFGIGLDADLCLGFHNMREEKPEKFNSRIRNKGVYVQVTDDCQTRGGHCSTRRRPCLSHRSCRSASRRWWARKCAKTCTRKSASRWMANW